MEIEIQLNLILIGSVNGRTWFRPELIRFLIAFPVRDDRQS